MFRRQAWIAAVLLALTVAILMILRSPIPLQSWLDQPHGSFLLAQGANPDVVNINFPRVKPLSAVAELGRKLFFDPRLSGSGKLSCASCHDPGHAYAPANRLSVQLGGGDMHRAGVRAVPSLEYLYRQPNFSIGPDNPENESVNLQQQASMGIQAQHAQKTALGTKAAAGNLVPVGGLFWDGRANTLQQQAGGPLFNPLEMDGGTPEILLAKLKQAAYAPDFVQLFGPGVFREPTLAVAEALFALSRFQIEDPGFRPFSSKYDAWLQGRARFTPSELRGYLAFNDPHKGNCAACHLDRVTRDGLPPLFTDMQYEALGVPRNMEIPANRDPHYFDLGLCGPYRTDLKQQTHYCGMFLTPTLRNAATRHAFFHNGAYHTLDQVLDFYALRDTEPARIYGKGKNGKTEKFNDIPPAERVNVDRSDPPFNRNAGDVAAMSAQDRRDIITFLRTLNDGYSAGLHESAQR
ncbi:MAG TPA: cytochrome c peroxidase [Burkholderiales bacterium]|nr:cytochrome c peroxidase [Burkholderiales bacterium]